MLKRLERQKITNDQFDIFQFLEGETIAYGLFEDRFGNLKKRFDVRFFGEWRGQDFVLEEDFRYDDGVTEERVWILQRSDGTAFTGTCDDSRSGATGTVAGVSSRMGYTFELAVNGKRITVSMDDRMHAMTDDIVLNRATMRKWGIRLGEIAIVLMKGETDKDLAA